MKVGQIGPLKLALKRQFDDNLFLVYNMGIK